MSSRFLFSSFVLWMLGALCAVADEESALDAAVFHGDVPWVGIVAMGVLRGNCKLAFKGGLQPLVAHWQGADVNSVESTFIHVLDPVTRNRELTVCSVRSREARGNGVFSTGTGVYAVIPGKQMLQVEYEFEQALRIREVLGVAAGVLSESVSAR